MSVSDTISTVTLSTEIPEMYCVIASYLTKRVSTSNVQFHAGSINSQSGVTLHPAAQIILHRRYNYKTLDFDVALVRVGDNV
jgi:hypothetical protein